MKKSKKGLRYLLDILWMIKLAFNEIKSAAMIMAMIMISLSTAR